MSTVKEPDLDPFECWMVESNIRHIDEDGLDLKALVNLLRARGYDRVARGVEQFGTIHPAVLKKDVRVPGVPNWRISKGEQVGVRQYDETRFQIVDGFAQGMLLQGDLLDFQ